MNCFEQPLDQVAPAYYLESMTDGSTTENSEPMKIVHVITGLSYGGAQNALYRLLAAQPDPSRSHVVCLTGDGVFGAKLRAAGISVTCLDMHPSWPSLRAFLRLVGILRRLRPTVVQTWMYHADLAGGLASLIAGIPVCWGIRNSGLSSSRTKFATRCVVRLCAVLSHFVPTTIVSCSARAADVHRNLGYAERFVIIPNGLDLHKFLSQLDARALRKSLGIPDCAQVIGHVARKDPQKDHPGLIAAFEELAADDPTVRLVLVGSGMQPGDPDLDRMLSGRSVAAQVIALGQRDDVEDIMHVFDVLAMSSSYGEAFPNVVVEAMACKVPCIVTDVGDAAEIVGDTGWVIPPSDPAALAAALRLALNEPVSQRLARGMRARHRVEENYDIARMVLAYRYLWDEVSGRDAKSCAG